MRNDYLSDRTSLRGASAVQKKLSTINVVQASLSGPRIVTEPTAVRQVAAEGVSGAGSAMPYLQRIQTSFGAHDISGIKAHTGSAAKAATSQIGAEAYASGNDIAFRSAPSLHTAAHEAAHIVQQRAGVQLTGGVGQVGDPYERHADAVADLVVAGQSAEDLLNAGP